VNTVNPYLHTQITDEHLEGLDEEYWLDAPKTELLYDTPKKILSQNDSPDIPFTYSLNPYQGCEHGCPYCYARNAHQYWGLSAGLDFETKIVVKKEAPKLLEKQFLSKNWQSTPIMLSGNTDCYQPIEHKLKITRGILKILAKYRNPVGIITKNSLILRDLDILSDLAQDNLVHVYITITTLNESLRSILEPRAASSAKRLKTIEMLTKAGIPTGVMVAPIIPSLNNHEIFNIIKAAADSGAKNAGYTMVRLNGSIGEIFYDWLRQNFPDRADKVWHQIQSLHNGQVNESRFGARMRGEGNIAENTAQVFRLAKRKFISEEGLPPYDLSKFRKNANLSLF
jgi:DNA repair photolyase